MYTHMQIPLGIGLWFVASKVYGLCWCKGSQETLDIVILIIFCS